MKTKSFSYRVLSVFDMSKTTLDALCKAAERHYDGKCKASTKQGGLLYRLNNIWILDDYPESFEVCLTFDEIDLLAKCAEMTEPAICSELQGLLRDINAESKQLNTES